MYERWMEQLNAKLKLGIGAVLFLIGLIRQLWSGKELDMFAFYFMSAALLCVANIIICKMSKKNVDFVLYLVLNMAVLIVGFALNTSSDIELGSTMIVIGVIGCCVVVDWIFHVFLIPCEGIVKRITLGLLAVIINIVSVALVFASAILIQVFVI